MLFVDHRRDFGLLGLRACRFRVMPPTESCAGRGPITTAITTTIPAAHEPTDVHTGQATPRRALDRTARTEAHPYPVRGKGRPHSSLRRSSPRSRRARSGPALDAGCDRAGRWARSGPALAGCDRAGRRAGSSPALAGCDHADRRAGSGPALAGCDRADRPVSPPPPDQAHRLDGKPAARGRPEQAHQSRPIKRSAGGGRLFHRSPHARARRHFGPNRGHRETPFLE